MKFSTLICCLLLIVSLSCEETHTKEHSFPATRIAAHTASPKVVPAAIFTSNSPPVDPNALDPSDPNVAAVTLTEQTTGRPTTSPLYIHTTRGIINWTPAKGDAGVYRVRITASDGELSDYEDITITVTESNDPPVIFAKIERSRNGVPSAKPILLRQ